MDELCNWVESNTRLNKRDDKGVTVREYLEQVKKSGGDPEELRDLPKFPLQMSRVWKSYMELHRARRYGMNGALPLSYGELRYYIEVTGSKLSKRDIETLFDVDRVYLETI